MRRLHIVLIILILIVLALPMVAQDSLPITEDVEYTIRSGDTLDTIGLTFDVDPDCIVEMNADVIGPNNTLNIGDTLLISVSCDFYDGDGTVLVPREVNTFEDDCPGVRIEEGDTIAVIAEEVDIAIEAILIENEMVRGSDLPIGMCLLLPEDAPAFGEPIPLRENPPTDASLGQGGMLIEGEEYIVHYGDTLDTIAQELDVSVVSIQLANNIIRTKDLIPGQVLIIPADAPPYGVYPAVDGPDFTGELYVVQDGDTLESIAEAFDVAVTAIILNNELDNEEDIFPGRTLIIPVGAPAFGDDAALLGQGGGGVQEHIVQPGDTLDTIAAFYNRNMDCLIEANGLEKPVRLTPGMRIIIDQACGRYIGPNNSPTIDESIQPASASAADTSAEEDTSAEDTSMEAEETETTDDVEATEEESTGGVIGGALDAITGNDDEETNTEEAQPKGG